LGDVWGISFASHRGSQKLPPDPALADLALARLRATLERLG